MRSYYNPLMMLQLLQSFVDAQLLQSFVDAQLLQYLVDAQLLQYLVDMQLLQYRVISTKQPVNDVSGVKVWG